jgi:hypothetical protein
VSRGGRRGSAPSEQYRADLPVQRQPDRFGYPGEDRLPQPLVLEVEEVGARNDHPGGERLA